MAEEKKTKKAAPKKTAANQRGDASSSSSDKQSQGPGFGIEKLFLKDVSVEVPNSPEIFTNREAPQINIELNNNAKPLSDGFYEVALQITVTSKQADKTAFLIDVTQAGIFAVKNVPEENIEPVMAITCPNILFPYAREAISDLVIKAGFSPVLLNPINFETLYMQQKQQQAGGSAPNVN
jgi:preprotein translocase subunit SecB